MTWLSYILSICFFETDLSKVNSVGILDFNNLRPNSYVEVIPHRIISKKEKFPKCELNAILMRCMNPNKN